MVQSVREAIAAVLEKNPAGLCAKAIALRMGKAWQTIYSYGDSSEERGRDIPISHLVALVLITGDDRPIGALCREVGGTFLPLPKAGAHNEVNDAVIASVKEFGESVGAVGQALQDGKMTPREARTVQREIAEAQRALAALSAAVARVADSEARR